MRILLTGSTGQVGRAIGLAVAMMGHHVVGLNRSAYGGGTDIIDDIALPGLSDRMTTEQSRCDAIIHAAATRSLEPHDIGISEVNGVGVQQVLHLAERWQVGRFIFLSGVGVIGRPMRLPITEEHPLSPRTAYHASKLYGEKLVELAGHRGLSAVTLRLTAPIGPGTPPERMLSTFVRQAVEGVALTVAGTGARRQDYVDVRDVGTAVTAALASGVRGLLNIGSGRPISNLDVARMCADVLDSPAQITFTSAPDAQESLNWEVSIDRATAEIGYQPRFPLRDSILAVAEEAPWAQ